MADWFNVFIPDRHKHQKPAPVAGHDWSWDNGVWHQIPHKETDSEREIREKRYWDYLNNHKDPTTGGYSDRLKTVVKPNLSRGYVPPPLKYTGPGNSLNIGPAYNEADADARHHDHQYHFSTNQEQIKEADSQLISKGLDHVAEGISGQGSVSNAIVGGLQAGGISIKKGVEKFIGQQYPKELPSKSCLSHHQSEIENVQRSRKRQHDGRCIPKKLDKTTQLIAKDLNTLEILRTTSSPLDQRQLLQLRHHLHPKN